jgi:hypothetical protein
MRLQIESLRKFLWACPGHLSLQKDMLNCKLWSIIAWKVAVGA